MSKGEPTTNFWSVLMKKTQSLDTIIQPVKNYIQLYYIIIYLLFLYIFSVEKWETYSKVLWDIFNFLATSPRIKSSGERYRSPAIISFLIFKRLPEMRMNKYFGISQTTSLQILPILKKHKVHDYILSSCGHTLSFFLFLKKHSLSSFLGSKVKQDLISLIRGLKLTKYQTQTLL